MAELKTKRNRNSVRKFLSGVEHAGRREDAGEVLKMMEKITGETAEMWGDSLVGFGSYRYKYASGRSGEWFLTGFSPRKQSLTIYIMSGFSRHEKYLAKLGKHKSSKSCLYINRLDDVDRKVLGRMIRDSVAVRRRGTPGCGSAD